MFKDFILNTNFFSLLLTCLANTFKKLIYFFLFKEYNIILKNLSFILIKLIRAARWKSLLRKSSWSERFTTKIEIDIIILSIFLETVLQTLKKRARLSMNFIIIMLVFWYIDNWAALINHLNMQLTFASLLNIVLILIFTIITFTIEQATMYMKHKKAMQITVFFKCTDFVELSLIELMYTFFFYVFRLCNDFSFFDIIFIFSFVMLWNICLNNSKEILNNYETFRVSLRETT